MRWLLGSAFLLKMSLLARGGLRVTGARPAVAQRQTSRMSSIALTTKRAAPVALGGTFLATGRETSVAHAAARALGLQGPKMTSRSRHRLRRKRHARRLHSVKDGDAR